MELPIPKKLIKIWDIWHLRGYIMLSLFLQAFLVSFASLRRRSKSTFVLFLIWSAYLLADWVAAVAIGSIIKSQVDDACEPRRDASYDDDLFAFWAAFLLLHLGGPDSITSFALEDNEFWLRHLVGLALQGLAAAYGMYLTLPSNKLWLPTALVFVVGVIKYGERTYALYLASSDRFSASTIGSSTAFLPEPKPVKATPGRPREATLTRARTMSPNQRSSTTISTSEIEEEGAVERPNSRTRSIDVSEIMLMFNVHGELQKCLITEPNDIKLLNLAYKLFETFRRLIVGTPLSILSQALVQIAFQEADHASVSKVIEYELSMLYEVLHTKVVVARRRLGWAARFTSFCLLVTALGLFFELEKHDPLQNFDVGLTYALLTGAVVLDTFSFVHLLSSDWTLGALASSKKWKRFVPSFVAKRRRWSEKVFQYNMISFCFDERPRWVEKLRGYLGREVLDKTKIALFSSSENVTEDLKKFIFEQLKERSKSIDSPVDGIKACFYRGHWTLTPSNYEKLRWTVHEFQYSETVLLWHLATELIYQTDDDRDQMKLSTDEVEDKEAANEPRNDHDRHQKENNKGSERKGNKRTCKILSDYMFYLLVMNTSMLSPVLGNWSVIFQDTCEEAKRFFDKRYVSRNEKNCHAKACKEILAVEGKVLESNSGKSLLFEACRLAKELKSLDGGDHWAVMDRMWVELMCYSALNCEPIVQAQQPGKGGELWTFTWLLMYHFGLGFHLSPR